MFGDSRAIGFRSTIDGEEHVALVAGDIGDGEDVLVRVHSECLTGDALGSLRCDCGPQLHAALAKVADEGRGVVLYLRGHEGRGIGLLHKLSAYRLQDNGRDTVDANLDLGLPADAHESARGHRSSPTRGCGPCACSPTTPKRAGLGGIRSEDRGTAAAGGGRDRAEQGISADQGRPDGARLPQPSGRTDGMVRHR